MKLLEILFFLVFVTFSSAQFDFDKRFKEFQNRFNKTYNGLKNLTENARKNFLNRLNEIEDHNARFLKGLESYKMDSYDFDDENPMETIARLCRTIVPGPLPTTLKFPMNLKESAPSSKDWTPFLTPVVNQGVG